MSDFTINTPGLTLSRVHSLLLKVWFMYIRESLCTGVVFL